MKREFLNAWRLVFAALCFFSTRVSAQLSNSTGVLPTESASQAWEILQKTIESDAAGQQTSAKEATRATLAAGYKSRAALFRKFHERYPEHPGAKEAQRLEAVALNRSAFNGDNFRSKL